MMQQGRQLGFVNERGNQIFLIGEIRQDFLDGNQFFEPLLHRLIWPETALPYRPRRFYPEADICQIVWVERLS